MRTWLAGIAVALFLAGTAGLMVQGKQLRDERTENAVLTADLKAANDDLKKALARASALEAENATQAEEAAVVCQGEGAELFAAGRRVGRAEGAARCNAP